MTARAHTPSVGAGDAREVDDHFSWLMAKVAADSGFQCASYKQRCLRRRVAVRMRARGVHDFVTYAALLDEDELERERLMDALTINVTRFFRDRSVYELLAEQVVPMLWRSDWPEIRVWSAGCASGEEPYSLGILFHAHAAAMRDERRLSRVRVLGTDIDRASLTAAAVGAYGETAFADVADHVRECYFSPEYPSRVIPEVREMVRLARHDLLRDDPPPASQHLIVCRNVLIYFDREAQERVFQTFRDLLVQGGVLVLGKVETLLGESRQSFTPLSGRERIFVRQ